MQNLGHADLVEAPGGGDALVLLGVRPVGLAQAFSPLGRETFLADVTWVDGWPTAALADGPGTAPEGGPVDLTDGLDGEWVAVRRTPVEVATVDGDRLVLTGDGPGLAARRPWFLGRRQRHLGATFSVVVDASAGTGGVALRLDEDHHVAVEAGPDGVVARATLAGFAREWTAALPDSLPAGELRPGLTLEPPSSDFRDGMVGGDRVHLWAEPAGGDDRSDRLELAELDGRYWTYEVAKSFTGRVLGVYAAAGTVRFGEIAYTGSDPAGPA